MTSAETQAVLPEAYIAQSFVADILDKLNSASLIEDKDNLLLYKALTGRVVRGTVVSGLLGDGTPTITINGVTVNLPTTTPLMRVVGAGTSEVNGDYTERGATSGKPYYNKVGFGNSTFSSCIKDTSGVRWRILDGDGSNTYYDAGGVSKATPDLVTLWSVDLDDEVGQAPTPTVTLTRPYITVDQVVALINSNLEAMSLASVVNNLNGTFDMTFKPGAWANDAETSCTDVHLTFAETVAGTSELQSLGPTDFLENLRRLLVAVPVIKHLQAITPITFFGSSTVLTDLAVDVKANKWYKLAVSMYANTNSVNGMQFGISGGTIDNPRACWTTSEGAETGASIDNEMAPTATLGGFISYETTFHSNGAGTLSFTASESTIVDPEAHTTLSPSTTVTLTEIPAP